MSRRARACSTLLVLSCGGDGSTFPSEADSSSSTAVVTSTTNDASSSSDGDPTASTSDGSGAAADTTSDGSGAASTGSSDASGSTTDAIASSSSSTGDASSSSSSSSGSETQGLCAAEPLPALMWVANRDDSTLSRIDTTLVVETGRYLTRADSAGSPRAVSVAASGRVAVVNTAGDIAVFHGHPADCEESNGTAGIQTSAGAGDVLVWDEEECRDYVVPSVFDPQRAVAWTRGTFDEDACAWIDESLWTSGVANGAIWVARYDENGDEVASTAIGFDTPSAVGITAAVAAGSGDLWAIRFGGGQIVRVEHDSLAPIFWDLPGVAIDVTIDDLGDVWVCGEVLARLDLADDTWDVVAGFVGHDAAGCSAAPAGPLWAAAAGDAIVAVDRMTLQITDTIGVPALAHGVSVDLAGDPWAVGALVDQAWRVDVRARTVQTVTTGSTPLAYGDMTGVALQAAG